MKKYIFSLITFSIGVGCMVTYNIIGSKVAQDGTLVEPFFLIPIGYLFLAISIIGFAISTIVVHNKPQKLNK